MVHIVASSNSRGATSGPCSDALGERHLYQINAAQAPRNGAFDVPKVRHLAGDVDFKLVGPTAPVLFKTRPVVGFETCRVKVTVFRLGSKNPGCIERIDVRVLEQQPKVIEVPALHPLAST